MTKEEKQLLLVDLCGRLPYGVKIKIGEYSDYKLIGIITTDVKPIKVEVIENDIPYSIEVSLDIVKIFLRPMSSMAEEEINEFILISDTVLWLGEKRSTCALSLKQMDWLNAHHFDFRNLIEKGLALEAPEGMYGKEEQHDIRRKAKVYMQ